MDGIPRAETNQFTHVFWGKPNFFMVNDIKGSDFLPQTLAHQADYLGNFAVHFYIVYKPTASYLCEQPSLCQLKHVGTLEAESPDQLRLIKLTIVMASKDS